MVAKSNNGDGSVNSLHEHEHVDLVSDDASLEQSSTKANDENSSSIELELQSPGFTARIIPISGDAFDLQINSTELIQELHQVLMDKEETCQYTCFSLHFNGQHMDNFAEVKSFKDLKQGSTIRVHEEPYSLREARSHIRHMRDLISCQDKQESYTGERGCSVSVLESILDESGRMFKPGVETTSPRLSRHQTEPPPPNINEPDIIPGHFIPGNQPLLNMIPPEAQSQMSLTCLAELSISHWNPPPNYRKLKGDLLYAKAKTVEGAEVGITACTRGFYLNSMTDDEFDPLPSEDPHMSLTLVELFSKISPVFRKNFSIAQRKRVNRNVLTRVPTSVQHWSWIVPSVNHSADELRSEDSWLYRLGYEEHILGQTRDWNEELQSIREMPAKTKSDRITKERALYKTYSDFLSAATRGAVAVVDGNMMPINPGEPQKTHMYIYNNIFFSLGFDVKDHYAEFGGDNAAYVACNHDLKGVRAITEAEADGLYTLGTAVVDYRGYRVACQTIMPGVLDKEQEESVVHGSIDFGKKIVSHDGYTEKLSKVAQELKCRPHSMHGDEDSEQHLVHISTECKGIIGNDGRHYLLDLLRLFPPDVNFMPDLEDKQKLADVMTEKGFPRKHPHKLPQLRQELVEAFVDSRYLAFVSHATSMVLQQQRSEKAAKTKSAESTDATKTEVPETESASSGEKPSESSEGIDTKKVSNLLENLGIENTDDAALSKEAINAAIESHLLEAGCVETNNNVVVGTNQNSTSSAGGAELKDIVKEMDCGAFSNEDTKRVLSEKQIEIVKASSEVCGSLSDEKFDISFNLDAFSPKVSSRVPKDKRDTLEQERNLIKDACKFLVHFMIPSFLKDCIQDVSNVPLDSIQLTETLHSRGINMRYLSYICTLCRVQKSKHSPDNPNEDTVIASLELLERVLTVEMICRSAKHVFKRYMQQVDAHCLSDGVALFLNCFLGAYKEPKLQVISEEEEHNKKLNASHTSHASIVSHSKKGKNKKKSHRQHSSGSSGGGHLHPTGHNSSNATSPSSGVENQPGAIGSWMHMSPAQLWRLIKLDLKEYYYCDLAGDTIDEIVLRYGFIHCSMLRSFCMKVGVQLKLRNYNFLSTIGPTFKQSDILNLFPVVKHALPKAKEGMKLLAKGQQYIQQGLLRPGCELITESLHFLNHVYGPIHSEIALCLKLLAHLNYILGDPAEAISHQHKAIIMYERCCGFDSIQTSSEYLRLSLYCFSNEQPISALYLLYRARYLSCVAMGEDHPEVAMLDTNIGLVLHAMQKFDLALSFLHNALVLNERHCGKMSLKTALSHHLKACVSSCQGDFRSALLYEKEAFNIYKTELGEENEKTKESSELLKHLTSQAVALQRKINEFSKSSSASFANAALPALFITQPTHKGVLEMLNVINGFFFFHIKKDSEAENGNGDSEERASEVKDNSRNVLSNANRMKKPWDKKTPQKLLKSSANDITLETAMSNLSNAFAESSKDGGQPKIDIESLVAKQLSLAEQLQKTDQVNSIATTEDLLSGVKNVEKKIDNMESVNNEAISANGETKQAEGDSKPVLNGLQSNHKEDHSSENESNGQEHVTVEPLD